MDNFNIKFLYKEKEENKTKIKNNILDIYFNLKSIFNDNLKSINIRIHNTRKSFDKYLSRKTKTWMIGNVNEKQEIDLISEKLIEKEKYHKKEEFYSLLKHELAHLFINNKSKQSSNIPFWLNEGIAEYISSDDKIIKNIFIPEDFFEKNINIENWNNSIDNNVEAYRISKYFIIFLLSFYKFNDLIKLLESLDRKYNEDFFKENFKIIFSKSFDEFKKEFYSLYNKK